MKAPSTPAAISRVKEAMTLVERAQGDLDRATQKLSAIRYGNDLTDKTFSLQERAGNLWYVLRKAAESRPQMSLDSEPDVRREK